MYQYNLKQRMIKKCFTGKSKIVSMLYYSKQVKNLKYVYISLLNFKTIYSEKKEKK